MLVNSIDEAIEPGQIMKSPLSTAAMVSEAIVSDDGKRDSSSEILLFVANPCMRLVSCVFVSCSSTNPGETKSAGNAQWMAMDPGSPRNAPAELMKMIWRSRDPELLGVIPALSSSVQIFSIACAAYAEA
ncbi:MAG: hypothetical protein L6R38_008529 [Xanthoria sp. 2 TBL-2021]|nr:MAG: hypothetical protein L6R38_008529 [Xanthoria sp. 2 TBL-2021]